MYYIMMLTIKFILLVLGLALSAGFSDGRHTTNKRQVAALQQLFGQNGPAASQHRGGIDNRALLMTQQLAAPFSSPVNLPVNHLPYSYPTNAGPEVLLPYYPFVHNANVGLDVNPGTRFSLGGKFEVPVWNERHGLYQPLKIFDGDMDFGNPNVQVNFGETVGNVNSLDIPLKHIYSAMLGLDRAQPPAIFSRPRPLPATRHPLPSFLVATIPPITKRPTPATTLRQTLPPRTTTVVITTTALPPKALKTTAAPSTAMTTLPKIPSLFARLATSGNPQIFGNRRNDFTFD